MAKYREYEEQVTNHSTGEVVTTSKTFKVSSKSVDAFYMTFVSMMSPIFEIKYIADMKVLAKMCTMMEYNTNEVHLTSGRRKEICSELSIHNSNLSVSIGRLKELKLIRGQEGTYEVSAAVYWKGTTSERVKVLKNRSLNVVFSERPEPDFENERAEVSETSEVRLG